MNDTIVCVNLLASDQLNSIEILNKFLFNIYRDSFDLHSNRMIGSALIGKSCMSCHEARDEKVINFSDNQNFVPFIRNHLSSFKMDTLNSDEIFFLKEYFNFFKKY